MSTFVAFLNIHSFLSFFSVHFGCNYLELRSLCCLEGFQNCTMFDEGGHPHVVWLFAC